MLERVPLDQREQRYSQSRVSPSYNKHNCEEHVLEQVVMLLPREQSVPYLQARIIERKKRL